MTLQKEFVGYAKIYTHIQQMSVETPHKQDSPQ